MSNLSLTAFYLLLLGIQFWLWHHLLHSWRAENNLKHRLNFVASQRWRALSNQHLPGKAWLKIVDRHLSELLETLRIKMTARILITISAAMLLAGIAFGGYFFQSAKGIFLFGGILGILPYFILKSWLVHRRLQAQLDFLPAVELFYQCYLVTGQRQIKVALQRAVDERRLAGPMQAIFEQLYRNLAVRGDDKTSMSIMTAALGHVWADHFALILQTALGEGTVVSDALRELLKDMRNARRSNEQERNRLLEIRIANFTPLLFLAIFMGINFYYNRANAFYYYFLDPQGRDMLLNAFVLIFLSFLMGMQLSRKKL